MNIEPWGEVWVDCAARGEAPLRSLYVQVGTHTVRTRYMDQEREERVTVERGEVTTVTHRYRR